jgi:hypothetical protein
MFKVGQLVRGYCGNYYVVECIGVDEISGENVIAVRHAEFIGSQVVNLCGVVIQKCIDVVLIGNNYKSK